MNTERIVQIIKSACAFEEAVTIKSELKLLSLDSLSFVGVIVEMEDEFGIEFDIDEIDISEWKTVGDVVKAVEEKIYAKKNN